ncbi:hypothetical protein K7432_002733 [Basidiobolus ranarum]|uniref:Uncharacterized protein n=1 Tax=Basidiobolus ranarum TaxID=34480 RepID=A0ABR2X139_9FUNG
MYSRSDESSPYNAVPDSEPDLGLDSVDNYPEPDLLAQSPPYVPPSPGPLPPLFSLPSPCYYDDISAEYSPPYVPDPIYPAQYELSLHPATPLSHEWAGAVPKSPLGPYSYYHEIEPIYVKECLNIFDAQSDIYDGWSIDSSHCDYDYSESLYNRLVDQYEEHPPKRIKLSTDNHPSSLFDVESKSRSGTVEQDAKCTPVGHQLLRGAERKFMKDNGLFDSHSPSEYFKHKKVALL